MTKQNRLARKAPAWWRLAALPILLHVAVTPAWSAPEPGGAAKAAGSTTAAAGVAAGGTAMIGGDIAVADNTAEEIQHGRDLFEARDVRAIPTLRNAAQKSLAAVLAMAGADILTAAPEAMPTDPAIVAALRKTALAHYWWATAADHFGRRDEAITALARASRYAGDLRFGTNQLARDVTFALGGIMRAGLPVVAPDDTLTSIASFYYNNSWTPRIVRFDYSNLATAPAGPGSAATGTVSSSVIPAPPPMREFLVTSGRLYIPSNGSAAASGLSMVPPLYREVAEEKLPPVLQLSNMVVGYVREVDGPNRGLWRQVVRVLYASPYITKRNRDDLPRAEALCIQFLKMHSLVKSGLGLGNPYSPEGITNLWLSEVSSWWPVDDDDPLVQSLLGAGMPMPNITTGAATSRGDKAATEIATSPLARPWRAAGQDNISRGDIMFFKMTQPREELEWWREIAHEYGHVALPALNGFKPPLEPYGNGSLGETLGMMWASSLADDIAFEGDPASANPASAPATQRGAFGRGLYEHVAGNAVPALRYFEAQGPSSPLRRDGTLNGLQYLRGLGVYLDRVYGTRVLGAALAPLVEHGGPTPNTNKSIDAWTLLDSVTAAMRDPFERDRTTLPIWLPGALETPPAEASVADFVARAPGRFRAGTRATCWLYVPPTAATLHVEWAEGTLKDGAAAPAAVPAPAGGLPTAAPEAMRVEGGWKYSTGAAVTPGSTRAIVINVGPRPGWQRFAFIPAGDVVVRAAWFERAAPL